MDRELQSGQAVLIVLLGMAIALTTVLSILGASTTDIKLSTNESESLRAFSAAEAGIEKSLVANSPLNGSIGNTNATYTTAVSSLAQNSIYFNYPVNLLNGETAILWFASHVSNSFPFLGCGLVNGTNYPCYSGEFMNVCWGTPGTSPSSATTPAVEVNLFYLDTPGNYNTSKVSKFIYDVNGSRNPPNSYLNQDGFALGGCTLGSTKYAFAATMDVAAQSNEAVPSNFHPTIPHYPAESLGPLFLEVKMLYNSDVAQPIGFQMDTATLPSQGSQVDSTGTLNQSNRKIEVLRPFNQVPPVFDTAVFSYGDAKQ